MCFSDSQVWVFFSIKFIKLNEIKGKPGRSVGMAGVTDLL